MLCSKITSVDIIAFAQALKVQPQTVQNYLSRLGAVFAIANPAWGYPLDRQAIKDAMVVAKKTWRHVQRQQSGPATDSG
jgi:hypothetical protein